MSATPDLKAVEMESPVAKQIPTGKIGDCVREALDTYFSDLEGHNGKDIYQLVIGEVERHMLGTVLRHTRGNQTRAAEMLGINRGTLRKKLKIYGLD